MRLLPTCPELVDRPILRLILRPIGAGGGGGSGTFASAVSYPVGDQPNIIPDHPSDILAADVDGDSVADLVVANYDGGSLGILIGNGDGTFQSQQLITGLDPARIV